VARNRIPAGDIYVEKCQAKVSRLPFFLRGTKLQGYYLRDLRQGSSPMQASAMLAGFELWGRSRFKIGTATGSAFLKFDFHRRFSFGRPL
jgi:hypothetical protein